MTTCLLHAVPSPFCRLLLIGSPGVYHSLQSAWCLADGLFEDRLEWLMVSMHCNVLLPVQILVPFVHACHDYETFLFNLHVRFFSVAQGV